MKNLNHKQPWYIILRENAKKHWFVAIVVVSVVFMLTIHVLYKIHAPCDFWIAEWTAGDMLSYGGSIVGAIATIYVLQETIHSTLEMQKEERIFSIRPYFIVKAEKYDENKTNNNILTDISSPRIDNNYWNGDISVLIRVQNVGAGNAVEGKVTLSQSDSGNLEYTCSSIPAFVVGTEQLFLVKFCKQSTLTFELTYSDIANLAHYWACTDIRIVRSGSKIVTYCGIPKMERINNNSK